MTPYHVARSKLFVRERFGKTALIQLDTAEIEAYIEHTRFPVPEEEQHAPTDDFPGLLRAADLIGQLADYQLPAQDICSIQRVSRDRNQHETEFKQCRRSAGPLPALFLADGTALSCGCLALPSSHARGPTMDC